RGYAIELEHWDPADGKGIDDLLVAGKVPEVLRGAGAFAAIEAVVAAASVNNPGPGHGVSATGGVGGLPPIQGNKRQLREVTDDALRALLARNTPPALFQRGGLLTRLRVREDTGTPYLEALGENGLRGVLARVADWYVAKTTKSRDDVLEEDA